MKNRRNQTAAVTRATAPPPAPIPTIRISFCAPDAVLSIPGVGPRSVALAYGIAANLVERLGSTSRLPRIGTGPGNLAVVLLMQRWTGEDAAVLLGVLREAALEEASVRTRRHRVGIATHAVEVLS